MAICSPHNVCHLQAILGIAFALVTGSGCALSPLKTDWRGPEFAAPNFDAVAPWSLASAEDDYSSALALEEAGNCECLPLYYRVAASTWHVLQKELMSSGRTTVRSVELYRSSVAKLLTVGQSFGRWDPCRGLVISSSPHAAVVPVSYQGFSWKPSDFQHLLPVGEYGTPRLTRAFRNHGVGVPLVVVRQTDSPQPFMRSQQPFAATAALRTNSAACGHELVLCDPLRVSTIDSAGLSIPLARDLTAPLALSGQVEVRQWLENFFQPGATGSGDGLFMIEPFQPGKIPVVFVHGLLSDPGTWADLANELRAHPDLNDRYQLWGFEYATGEPFLTSAAVLRRHLKQVRDVYDPTRSDAALSEIVLIGHSMGGLVAKLQVTYSGHQLWQAVAIQPLEALATASDTRSLLRDAFYFQPSPDVTRTVFIGTPHRGSSWARRPVGRLGSALVRPADSSTATHRQLVDSNPNVFKSELQNRFPTSVDLLKPESELLAATAALPYSPVVSLHSIVGHNAAARGSEPTDGVVPVSSARLIGVRSEQIVEAKHATLHRNPATVNEVVRILREHLRQASHEPPVTGSRDAPSRQVRFSGRAHQGGLGTP